MPIFKNRTEAGRRLAKKLEEFKNGNIIVFAIPNGGVPVAYEIAKVLNASLDLLIIRKILYPWTTEAGFGAIDPDGTVILEKNLIEKDFLSNKDVKMQTKKAREQLKLKIKKLREKDKYPDLNKKIAVVVDDGLATGYSMLLAIRFLKKRKPEKIVVVVPTASYGAYEKVKKEADRVICPNVKKELPFAVADAYSNWYDVPDEEVLGYLDKISKK